MADRYPLIYNPNANQLQELQSGDSLDLGGSGISSVTNINASGVITATSFSGSGANLTGIAVTTDVRTNSLVVSGVSTFSGITTVTGETLFAKQLNVSGVVTATTFSGALTGNVTGNATGLSGTPNITVGNIIASSATISGNVSVAGTVTYEDVTNVDSIGIITARTGIVVTAGGINASGVVTATSFVGSGANLTNLNIPSSFNELDAALFN